jgi:hypothetical protein
MVVVERKKIAYPTLSMLYQNPTACVIMILSGGDFLKEFK